MAPKDQVKNQAANVDDLPDFSKFKKEQIGFAPYWKPAVGKKVYAVPVARDDRDPKFVRYVFRNLMGGLECQRGPVDGAEPVTVGKNEFFSMGEYAQIADPVDFYLSLGVPVPVLITVEKQTTHKSTHPDTIGEPRTLFHFSIACAPETSAMLETARLKKAAELSQGSEG